MNKQLLLRSFTQRLFIVMIISIGLVLGISELIYQLQYGGTSRQPTTIVLVIPAGTGDKIAAGYSPEGIPNELSFVIGDTLIVKNEDTITHQLGPVWIPAGGSASLNLDMDVDYMESCSFQTTNMMGLNVTNGVTWGSRLRAIGIGVPPTMVFLFMYSLVVIPLKLIPEN
jgi:hypothetical protein